MGVLDRGEPMSDDIIIRVLVATMFASVVWMLWLWLRGNDE